MLQMSKLIHQWYQLLDLQQMKTRYNKFGVFLQRQKPNKIPKQMKILFLCHHLTPVFLICLFFRYIVST